MEVLIECESVGHEHPYEHLARRRRVLFEFPTGATGPQGVTGATGPSGLTWQGTWSSSTAYAVYNAVAYNGSSYGGNNLNPVNSPTQTAGEIDGAAQFNGTNQYAEASAFSGTGTSPVTVSFWNYVATSDVQVSWAFDVGNTAATDAHRFSASAPWSDSILYWDYGANTDGETGRVTTSYSTYLNAWTEVTLVSTGSGDTFQAIYLNGALAASAASSASSTVTGDLYIGAYPWATQYGPPYENGKIDEFRIANVVRSASWILAEYNNQSSPSTFATAGAFTLINFVTEPQGFVF